MRGAGSSKAFYKFTESKIIYNLANRLFFTTATTVQTLVQTKHTFDCQLTIGLLLVFCETIQTVVSDNN